MIRDARIGDEAAIARVHVAAWRAAYRGMMPDDFLDALDEKMRAARWREWLERLPTGRRMIVATANDALVAFAGFGGARDEVGTGAELYMIYVSPSAWGTGVAGQLLATCVESLSRSGYRDAFLWVLRHNVRARHFYEREGWKHEGERRDTIRENGFTLDLDELRYVRAL